MTQTMEARVRRILADVFHLDSAPAGDLTPGDVEEWDSAGHLNLTLAIEQEFSISLTPEETERMESLGTILDVLRRRRNGAQDSMQKNGDGHDEFTK